MALMIDKAHDAYTRIKRALLRHELAPGTFINIRAIAFRMRVSPTPVREALIRLAYEDVIQFSAGRGYYSKAMKADEVKADYEMAFMIAKYSIEKNKIAFDRISAGSLPKLCRPPIAAAQSRMEAEGAANYLEMLYERLAMISGNAKLVRATRQFGERTHHIRSFGLMIEPEFAEFFDHMARLEDCLVAGDQMSALNKLVHQYHAKEEVLCRVLQEFEFRAERSNVALEDLLG